MYQILLVDDELPALRFLETIIAKYAPDFSIISQQRDGASALAWLREHPYAADVMITDIRMPDMDGITLSKSARNLRNDLHIVIVSGYSEFEYAHGAIEASVDDYILKPVSVSHMRELLEKIKRQLDVDKGNQVFRELTALLNGKFFDHQFLYNIFSDFKYYFSLLRFGNVLYPQKSLQEISLRSILSMDSFSVSEDSSGNQEILPDLTTISESYSLTGITPKNIYFLTGRDPQEFLIFTRASGSVLTFHKAVRQIAKSSGYTMATVILGQTGIGLDEFELSYTQASRLLRRSAVIGHYHETTLPLSGDPVLSAVVSDSTLSDNHAAVSEVQDFAGISSMTLRRLELCVSENNQKDILRIFKTLGKEWDEKQISQRRAYVLMMQLLHLVEAVRLDNWKDTEKIMTEAETLTNTATSYQDLLESLFEILYNPEHIDLKQRSPEDMYQYAIRTIHKKFNQSISIQTVCSEIGISQTYLSRLFRKYGKTSFNAYLVQCRMENAKKMLEEHPDMPLNQVSVCVGYEDYAYFSKVFRQANGCTPSQFQQIILNNQ